MTTDPLAAKDLPDGRVAELWQMIYTVRLTVRWADDPWGYSDGWCYHTRERAEQALAEWDGEGEPAGWHRHPTSGRRRPEGDPQREYVNP